MVAKVVDGKKLMICWDLNGHVGLKLRVLRVFMEGLSLERGMWRGR